MEVWWAHFLTLVVDVAVIELPIQVLLLKLRLVRMASCLGFAEYSA